MTGYRLLVSAISYQQYRLPKLFPPPLMVPPQAKNPQKNHQVGVQLNSALGDFAAQVCSESVGGLSGLMFSHVWVHRTLRAHVFFYISQCFCLPWDALAWEIVSSNKMFRIKRHPPKSHPITFAYETAWKVPYSTSSMSPSLERFSPNYIKHILSARR